MLLRALRGFPIVLVLLAPAAPAAAELKLSIQNGRITLDAKDVTVRQILAEWARLGQIRIVNGDKVPGGVVTLTLVDMPEARALDVVLRAVGGYMAAPRAVPMASASTYDRIFILPTSTPPPASARPVATPPAMMVPQPMQNPSAANEDSPDPGDPQPGDASRVQTGLGPFPGPQPIPVPFPGIQPVNPATAMSPSGVPVTATPPTTTPQTMPFPAGTSPVPGVVLQPPPQPGQRPPGAPRTP